MYFFSLLVQVGVGCLQFPDVSHVVESPPFRMYKGLHVNLAMVSTGYLPSPAESLSKLTLPPDRLISEQVAANIFTVILLILYVVM